MRRCRVQFILALWAFLVPVLGYADFPANGTFDIDLNGWSTPPVVSWSSLDANGSLSSGSALVTHNLSSASGNGVEGSRGCLPFLAGSGVALSGKAYLPTGQSPGYATIWGTFFDGAGCTGAFIGFANPIGSVAAAGAWTPLQGALVRPSGAKSMAVSLVVWKSTPDGSTQAHFDDVHARSATGDFDLSGQTDVFWRNSSGATAEWLMNGVTVGSSAAQPVIADSNWRPVGFGDFQLDGKADILWRNAVTGDNVIWFMNGLSAPVGAVLPSVPPPWRIAGVGDFQNDGKADVIWRNDATGANVVWLMNGPSVAASGLLPTVADPAWDVAGIGDFQGDRKADLLWHNSSSGANSIWFMDGLSVALSSSLPTLPSTAWAVAGVRDFQADGKADILWRNGTTGENMLWLMDASTVAVATFLPPVTDTTWSIALVGDFQGDGKADIIWRNSTTGSDSVWLMNVAVIGATAALPAVDPGFQIVRGR